MSTHGNYLDKTRWCALVMMLKEESNTVRNANSMMQGTKWNVDVYFLYTNQIRASHFRK